MRSSSFSTSSASTGSTSTKPTTLPARAGSLNKSMSRLRMRGDSVSTSSTPPKSLLSSFASASASAGSSTGSSYNTSPQQLARKSLVSSSSAAGSLSRVSPTSSLAASPVIATANRRPRLSAIDAPSTASNNTAKQHYQEEHKTAPPSIVTTSHPQPSYSSSSSSSAAGSASSKILRRRLSIMQSLDNSSHLDGTPDPKQTREPRMRSAKSPTAAAAASSSSHQPASSSSSSSALPSIATRPKSLSFPSASSGSSASASAAVSSYSPPSSMNHLSSNTTTAGGGRVFSHYSSLSKVGYIPYNPAKVNQDRALELVRFNNSDSQALFAVFDGHGQLGHEVSTFLTQELPRQMVKQLSGGSGGSGGGDMVGALSRAFVETNSVLAQRSGIDCTFSGSTAIVVYLADRHIYTCNVGDSRAVLARRSITATPAHTTATATAASRFTAHPLSIDQKPDRPDERRRILDCRGRVEPCHGSRGEDIGPPRVWLATQDVPGLAMSRSFGDLIAASVGVIARPEVDERVRGRAGEDCFVVLGSDGVWEFMSDEEVVELVGRVGGATGDRAEEAARAVVDEATRRWQREEEVIDDITCVIVYF